MQSYDPAWSGREQPPRRRSLTGWTSEHFICQLWSFVIFFLPDHWHSSGSSDAPLLVVAETAFFNQLRLIWNDLSFSLLCFRVERRKYCWRKVWFVFSNSRNFFLNSFFKIRIFIKVVFNFFHFYQYLSIWKLHFKTFNLLFQIKSTVLNPKACWIHWNRAQSCPHWSFPTHLCVRYRWITLVDKIGSFKHITQLDIFDVWCQ